MLLFLLLLLLLLLLAVLHTLTYRYHWIIGLTGI